MVKLDVLTYIKIVFSFNKISEIVVSSCSNYVVSMDTTEVEILSVVQNIRKYFIITTFVNLLTGLFSANIRYIHLSEKTKKQVFFL
jgi:hypothetical protein